MSPSIDSARIVPSGDFRHAGCTWEQRGAAIASSKEEGSTGPFQRFGGNGGLESMRKATVLSVGLILVAGIVGAQGISGSAHDFSGETWSGGTICLPCHTTHHGETTFVAPLWNHEVTAATFVMYSSPTRGTTPPFKAFIRIFAILVGT